MDGPGGARQAINLDHERRLLQLETDVADRDRRMTILEAAVASLGSRVDETLLAKRVTEGVSAALQATSTTGLNRWTKIGIAAAIATSVGSFLLALAQALGHG